KATHPTFAPADESFGTINDNRLTITFSLCCILAICPVRRMISNPFLDAATCCLRSGGMAAAYHSERACALGASSADLSRGCRPAGGVWDRAKRWRERSNHRHAERPCKECPARVGPARGR